MSAAGRLSSDRSAAMQPFSLNRDSCRSMYAPKVVFEGCIWFVPRIPCVYMQLSYSCLGVHRWLCFAAGHFRPDIRNRLQLQEHIVMPVSHERGFYCLKRTLTGARALCGVVGMLLCRNISV